MNCGMRSGKHPQKALTQVRINSLSKPGRYADGNGLYLVVDPSRAKRWVLRTLVHGKRRDIGLGGLRLVSLAEARDKASEFRKIARDGGNPLDIRRRAKAIIPTFADAAQQAFDSHKGAWRNDKHASQWINTLKTYAFPIIGETRVDHIETRDVMKVLTPIWLAKPETARRLKQRLSTVLDWAKAAGFRSGDNPAEGVSKGLPKQPDRKNHFEAIPFDDVAAFLNKLRGSNTNEYSRLAFEFLILTATRTSEVLLTKWSEVDLDQKIWIIPADRMKAGREHRVPLAPQAIKLLNRTKEISTSDFVFPGRRADEPMSNMVFLMTLRRMKLDFTAHGFRSAFRDWAAERTNFPRDVCEMALAHTIKSKVEAAYRRGDLFEKRRELMQAWAIFATREIA